MRIGEAIKKLLKDSNISYRGLAERLGKSSTGGLTAVTKRNEASVSTLLKICNALDYDVIIKPRYGENKAERTIVLTPAEERAE